MSAKNTISPCCLSQQSSTIEKRLSLRFELDEMRVAVEAARILSDLARHRSASDAHDQETVPHAVSAVLALIECRMHLVLRAISGDLDSKLLLAHHNETRAAPEEVAGEDILLDAVDPSDSRDEDE
jgi:hypothetical protein